MTILEDDWDLWFGQLTLNGTDPRRWDLHQLVSAYEVSLRQGAKDEAAWRRLRAQLYAEPSEVRRERLADPAAGATQRARSAMTLDSAEALLAAVAARDARYGAA